VKAAVSPSQPGVGRVDYSAWLAISDGSILTAYCSCPAGAGRSCSHVAAIAYSVIIAWDHGIAGETCTDRERLWGKGSNKILSCHEELADIVVENMKFNYVESDKVAKPQQLLDHKDIRTFVETNPFRKLWECRGTMLNWVLTAPETVAVAKQPLLHEHHDIIASGATVPSCSSCKVFFNKYVEIGNNKVNLLQEQTKRQASSLWTDSRKVRLTASKLSSVPKTTRANPEKFVTSHIYNRFKGCAATRHGQKCEPLALKWFEHHSGLTVQSSGLVLRRDEQYFGASPDGISTKKLSSR